MDVGATLREAREQKGLTLDRLSHVLRVTLPILVAIERNDPRAIPPRPYGRGFVRNYASEVGLDPEQTVRDFFAQFAPAPEPVAAPPEPSHTRPARHPAITRTGAWAIGAIGVVMLLLVIAVSVRSRPAPAGVPRPVATSGRSAPSTASTSGRVAPAPAAEGVAITLEATGPSWVSADVDGRRAIYRTLHAGDREALHAKQVIRIRTGNAGALRWQVGRRPVTTMGNPGEVLSTTVTAADARR